uniref:Uncharacterized protein n=1 Tax=Daphnia galeata TaxID=27404 RepID=A0A8J2S9X8_9CRUS|nr:unnamed protein product [Daphnia galeata]
MMSVPIHANTIFFISFQLMFWKTSLNLSSHFPICLFLLIPNTTFFLRISTKSGVLPGKVYSSISIHQNLKHCGFFLSLMIS